MRISLDITPLAGDVTGVGMFTSGLIGALAKRSDVHLTGFAITRANVSAIRDQLPGEMALKTGPRLPASVLLRLWPHIGIPPAQLWTGRTSLVHGTNFVVPPTETPALVTVHDLTSIRFPQMCTPATLRYPANILRAVYTGAHIHTCTQAVATEVHELLDVPEERIHVIPPGLPSIETHVPMVTAQRRFILAIGTIEPRKDYPSLLRAFDVVAGSIPDVDLVIAGAPGWALDDFDRALASMTHRDRVRILGRVSDGERISLLQAASVLAYPSVYEGFGLPPLEAMQLDLPVVATSNEAVVETVGDAALFSEIADVDSLAVNLERALSDEDLRQSLIQKGRSRVGLYDWDRSAEQMVALYNELRKADI